MNDPVTDRFNRPIHDLRISVIDRCNFRCPYCMPQENDKKYSFLAKKEWLSDQEIVRLVKIFVELGVKKVRITGGEPLLRPNLFELIQKLSGISDIEDITLTTNGSLLKKYAAQLKASGLNRLTISLDALDARVFQLMSGKKGSLENVLAGIQEAERQEFDSIKINVVVQKGVNDHAILDMVKHFKNTKHILRFIEFMDVGNCNHWESKYVLPSKIIVSIINERFPIETIKPNYFGEVASRYRFKDGSGEIGFVSSVSQPFCRSCTRVRLTADGQMITCLFAQSGKNIKELIRNNATDQELLECIKAVWQNREDRYSELRHQIINGSRRPHKLEMFQIGG